MSRIGPYKRYLLDPSVRVPRQTRYNWRQLQRLSPAHCDEPDALGQSSSDVGLELPSGHDEVGDGDGDDTDAEADSDRESVNDSDADTTESSDEEGGATEMHASGPAPLYPGAQITEEMGVKLLATRHRLSFSALGDILKLVTVHLPSHAPVPPAYKSTYMLMKTITSMGGNMSNATISHR